MEKNSTAPILSNRYQLQQTIGTGGTAVVYRARDLMLERPVAIKVLRQDFTQEVTFRERFRHEAKAAANLSHPNIVTVHDFGFDSNRLYIVMEYVPGTDLKTLIKQHGRLPLEESVNLIVQACAGIGYAHRGGFVHCDVKPHNILVSPDIRVKVTDFGIARALASIHPDEKHDVVWGSPQYFSPEQASGAAPSPASDVYSLGVILYELLSGQLPFTASGAEELARLHREQLPPSPRDLNPEIPVALEQILLKVLSKEPSARYRTADQLGLVLSAFTSNNIDSPQPTGPVSNGLLGIRNNSTSQRLDASKPGPAKSVRALSANIIASANNPERASRFNWFTLGLSLIAFVTVGGLVPYWLYVILFLRSQVR